MKKEFLFKFFLLLSLFKSAGVLFAQIPIYFGTIQSINSTDIHQSIIDDFTEHTYSYSSGGIGSFADAQITRTFYKPIKKITLTIVAGQADDVGYVGNTLVTGNGTGCFGGSQVSSSVDVTNQVTFSDDLTSASFTLRAKETCCYCVGGWGEENKSENANARFHWVVSFNNDCVGNALQFDGVDDYVNVGVRPNLEMTSEITLETWIFPTGPGSTGPHDDAIIVNREGEYEIARFEDGTIRYALANSSPGFFYINTGYVPPLNTWTHIALTYSASAGIVKIYANGVEKHSSLASGNIGDHPLATELDEFRIGSRQGVDNVGQSFQGIIDEVRVWNKALSQSTIQQWLNQSVAFTHADFLSLAGYWKFDEGVGATTVDASGNENTGTLTNLPTWIVATTPLNLQTFYRDTDGDGYGDPNNSTQDCSETAGYVADNTDCDDRNRAIHPGATEVCNEIDDNCNGQIHDVIFYLDADGDGFGNAASTIEACPAPEGYVTDNTDCDDTNPAVYPDAEEICNGIDDDCDGVVDEGMIATFYHDADGDGFGAASSAIEACSMPSGYVEDNTDCDDTNPAVHPEAEEVCNGIDDNCDGLIDEDVKTIFYRDADGDGFGDPFNFILSCSAPPGYVFVLDNIDCDDTNPAVHFGATEVCNGIDDDCDGEIDEDVIDAGVKTTFYRDADGDGYGAAGSAIEACSMPSGYVENNTDCDDTNPAIHPGATETCNGIDDDCDGQIDEDVKITFYRDADGDGFGNPALTTQACSAPSGYVSNNTDCDDSKAPVHPGATESCNGLDDDCDGQIDEGLKTTFYRDADGDGFGNPAIITEVCSAPSGYVANNTDCDDAKSSVHPGATEVCNGIDDNCDGQIDEDVKITFYRDADGDGFGNNNNTVQTCSAPVGYVSDNTDCNDNDASVHTISAEVCDGIDNDCDGLIDDGVQSTFYRDVDNDGFGVATLITQACSAPSGYVANNTDCDDSKAAIHPGATESCNGIDDDCDGQIDEGLIETTFYRDADGDGFGNPALTTQACSAPPGYVSNNTDCDDSKATVHFGATESCNGIDDNCDGQIDEGVNITFYRDADGDGFGNNNNTVQTCSAPIGYVSDNTDCNDNDASVHTISAEVCDGIDNDCDGQIDDGVQSTFYRDVDNDGFGDATLTTQACSAPSGYVSNNTDCDDSKATVHPGAAEVCNGIDDDCDGQIDEGARSTFYRDADGDGYGNALVTIQACAAPIGYVTNNTDCNDGNASVHPGATDICNGIDDNCNGQIDEGVKITFYRDADGDGYGNALVTTQACTAPIGYVNNNTDCNDGNASVHPGATDVCNGIDDNCNGQIDEQLCSGCTNATGLTTTNITSSGATLTWVATVSPVQWQLEYKKTNPGSKWTTIILAGSARSVNITLLSANQNYNWHIRAKCGKKWTSYSTTLNFKTLPVQSANQVYAKTTLSEKGNEENAFTLRLYPNPSYGEFIIELHHSQSINKDAKIELIDILGQTVYTESGSIRNGILQQRIKISPFLSKGIYMVRIVVDHNTTYQSKLIYAK